jgi:hypothetical protein
VNLATPLTLFYQGIFLATDYADFRRKSTPFLFATNFLEQFAQSDAKKTIHFRVGYADEVE